MKNILKLCLVALFVMINLKNINLKISVKIVNSDILKQKMILVYIVDLKNMEALLVMNANMKNAGRLSPPAGGV